MGSECYYVRNTKTGEEQSLGFPFDDKQDAIDRANLMNSNYSVFDWVAMFNGEELEEGQ